MKGINVAIIGGTGAFKQFNAREKVSVDTKYGKVNLDVVDLEGTSIALLKRHGSNHSIPPHKINYRANIMALKMLGVKRIFATAAVGSLHMDFEPGNLLLITDFIDFTWGRDVTFFDEPGEQVIHVDMTTPYCPKLRENLHHAACLMEIPLRTGKSTYVCTQGPRFETASEISMYGQLGADVVGMTSVPEVILAREAEICYATIAIVTNYATGISQKHLTHQEVLSSMNEAGKKLEILFTKTIQLTKSMESCPCQWAVSSQSKLGG